MDLLSLLTLQFLLNLQSPGEPAVPDEGVVVNGADDFQQAINDMMN